MRKLLLALLSLALTSSVGAQSCCDKNDVLYQGEPGAFWPRPISGAATPVQRTCTIDAADERCAWVLQVPKTGSITDLYFRTTTVTTGATLTLTLESVDASTGNPSGSLIATNTTCTVAVADSDDNAWKSCTMTAAYSGTQGDIVAVVADNPDVSPGNMLLVTGMSNTNSTGFPYALTYATATWAKVADGVPVVGLAYSDGAFHNTPGVYLVQALNTNTFSSASTPDEIGIRVDVTNRRRACGAWVYTNSAVNFDVVLYVGTTAIRTASLDGDIIATSGSAESVNVLFSSCVTLGPNITYRLVAKPGASNMTFYEWQTPSAAGMGALEMGTRIYRTSRTDAAASWTDTATSQRPMIGFIE